jgi:excisionase family DNA binding protein
MENRLSEQLLTTAQVAERLSMKESTIRAWVLARRLKHVRIGRRAVRIPADEVSRIIAEGSVPAREHDKKRAADSRSAAQLEVRDGHAALHA